MTPQMKTLCRLYSKKSITRGQFIKGWEYWQCKKEATE